MRSVLLHYCCLMLFVCHVYGMQQGTILKEGVPARAMVITNKGLTEITLMDSKSLVVKSPECKGGYTINQNDPHCYCSIASNNEYVAIQTDRFFKLFDAHQPLVIWQKEKDEQLKKKTCASDIGLLKNNNMIVHSIVEAKNKLKHSISLYSPIISLHFDDCGSAATIEILFTQEFDKRADVIVDDTADVDYETMDDLSGNEQELQPHFNITPLLACHPRGTEVAFKIFNNRLTILSHIPRATVLLMHLLSPIGNDEERELNVLPQDIKQTIKMYLALLYSFTVEHVPVEEVSNELYGNDSYHMLQYSPDGNSIAFLYPDRLGIYDMCQRHISYYAHADFLSIAASEVAAIGYRSMAFHPASTICALLMTNGSIVYWDIKNNRCISKIIPSQAKNNPGLSFGKKILFSQDGTKLYAIAQMWKTQMTEGQTKYLISSNNLVSYDVSLFAA